LGDCPGETPRQFPLFSEVLTPPPSLHRRASDTRRGERVFGSRAFLFLEMIKLKARGEEEEINCGERVLFFHIKNGFQTAQTQTHTHTHSDSLSSLLTLHHRANPACFTRQETREAHCYSARVRLISAKSVCASLLPFHVAPVSFGSQESEDLSSLGSARKCGRSAREARYLWAKMEGGDGERRGLARLPAASGATKPKLL